jgi:hypothetical protein
MGALGEVGCGVEDAHLLRQRTRVRSALLSGTAIVGAAVCVALCPTVSDAATCNAGTAGALATCINTAANGDTIALTANITLTADLPAVQKNVTIEGNNHTLDGASTFRGLFVGAFSGSSQVPVTVAIQDLTIQNAKAQGGTGGSAQGAGGGGAGLGGALFVASLTARYTTISGPVDIATRVDQRVYGASVRPQSDAGGLGAVTPVNHYRLRVGQTRVGDRACKRGGPRLQDRRQRAHTDSRRHVVHGD